MYRKRMSEALQEARAYRDPVNEDRGFSTRQIKMAYGVLNDPRYKQGNYSGAVKAIEKIARGLSNHPDVKNALKRANEELEEGAMKRVVQGIHDKLSKEGGAAGFDDLKKAAKSMGVTLTKDMLKDMPGVKQHRDGDYILENKSSELINLYQIKNKTPEIEARIAKLEKELKVIKREETELEEAFTLADYRKLEADNQHAEAAAKLVNQYGTPEEKKEIAAINARHKKTGYISGPDFKRRVQISNKYYSRLK
jgi:hypothetical protein